jgi:hypothetical protein
VFTAGDEPPSKNQRRRQAHDRQRNSHPRQLEKPEPWKAEILHRCADHDSPLEFSTSAGLSSTCEDRKMPAILLLTRENENIPIPSQVLERLEVKCWLSRR